MWLSKKVSTKAGSQWLFVQNERFNQAGSFSRGQIDLQLPLSAI